MIRLITPPGMLLTTALLAIYCAYAFLIGSIEESWILFVGGFVSVVACYGTAMLRPWSKFLVYGLAIGFVCKLFSSIIDATRAGYFQFQFGSASEILWSLAPSLLMVAISLLCCVLVHRYYRRRASSANTPITQPETTVAAQTAPPNDA